jgi:class 3 adenylate cyclase
MTKKSPLEYLAGFAATAALSWFLLMLFPFYPSELMIVIALALGLVGIKSPRSGLMLAILLALIAATYQGALVGLTFFIVLVFASALNTWEIASLITSWILAFLTSLPSLAITPTIFVGLHEREGDALKVGILSGITIFLLSWTRDISRAGLMLVPSTSSYVQKAIPTPWYLTSFIPNVDTFTVANLSSYYAPLLKNMNDFHIYVLLIAWGIAGYLTALLASKKRSPRYFVSGVVGVLPAVLVGSLFIQTPPAQIAAVLIVAVILPLAYIPIHSRITEKPNVARSAVPIPVPVVTVPKDGRQLAAIMFTELVGYTTLQQDDEPAAVGLLKTQEETLRPILEKYHGREIKTIGDALLVEFTNTLEAVNCAVDIQKTLEKQKLLASNGKEMKLRIGIHVGDVTHREGNVFGAAVNIASRIEPLAEPGGICISRQVYDQVWNEVKYEITELGLQELKNVQYPTEIYRVSPDKVKE